MVMRNNKSQSDRKKSASSDGKTGVIPKDQITGSDADLAYDGDQEFVHAKKGSVANDKNIKKS